VDDAIVKRMKEVEKAVLQLDESVRSAAFTVMKNYILTGNVWSSGGESAGEAEARKSTSKKSTAKRSTRTPAVESRNADVPDEDTFFKRIAHESGVDESDIRDILQLASDGSVRVTVPTRRLGSSIADQARTAIALVAGARGSGLEERPVDTDKVRRELNRKGCYQQNNFAAHHLGPLRGFNAGGRNEIVLTSRWVDEFAQAVKQAAGQSGTDSAE
jgi:hypothetical protein